MDDPAPRKPCAYCSRPLPDVCGKQDVYCPHCRFVAKMLQSSALGKVRHAVKSGKLAPVRSLKCVDCSAPATLYEHRSYDRPLDVVPVCYRCNRRRGPAVFVI